MHQWDLNESSKLVVKNYRFWSYYLMGISLSKSDPLILGVILFVFLKGSEYEFVTEYNSVL